MSAVDVAPAALLAATTLHLGFQLTVTTVVYPALLRAQDWDTAHAAHTRGITPVVVLVYGILVLCGAWALVATGLDPWVLLAVAGAATALLTTALVAGPTHGRLTGGKDPGLLRRLVVADRVRTIAALVATLAAALAVIG